MTEHDIAIAAALEEKTARLRDIESLAEHPAWTGIVLPWIERTADAEAEAHEDEERTAEQRAEHLHSMKLFRTLRTLLAAERRRIESFMARQNRH